MPIYEYACGSCEHRFETIQRASEDALVDCPTCGEAALKKLLSAPNFRLKGSGWYETDFKTGDKRNVVADATAEGGGEKADSSGAGKAEEGAKTESAKAESGKAESGNGGRSAQDGKAAAASTGGSSPAGPSASGRPAQKESKDSSPPKAKG